VLEQGRARIFTLRGRDWTAKYGPLVKAAAELPADTTIIDGEIIVTNDDGISDFRWL
jgi:ATP-dependent DNA ligase